ncbi:MAG: type VII secretion protein EssC [Lachnospiraceae bacterium]|nr:type VII secretion protein EssC [Lachnospiraceae bacterium]
MGFVISIYTEVAFREYNLSNIKNDDVEIIMRKSDFRLQDDIRLQFEVLDGILSIKKGEQYRGINGDKQVLQNNSVLSLETDNGITFSIIVRETEVVFGAFPKFRWNTRYEISIGREDNNVIKYNLLGLVSRSQARIYCMNNDVILESRGKNAIYVNNNLVSQSCKLIVGDYINILGLHLVFLGDMFAIELENNDVAINQQVLQQVELQSGSATMMLREKQAVAKKSLFHRAPRLYEQVKEKKFEIESAPVIKDEDKESMIMTIGPSITMVLPMLCGYLVMSYASSTQGRQLSPTMFVGIVAMAGSALTSVIWGTLRIKKARKKKIEETNEKKEAYISYLKSQKETIETAYNETISVMYKNYPGASDTLRYDEKTGLLWNRNQMHEDFLCHRIGLGDEEWKSTVEVAKERFEIRMNDYSALSKQIKDAYKIMYNVPITVDLLKHKLIGIVGGNSKQNAMNVARSLIQQIIANNCYTDVKLVFLYDGELSEDYGHWNFAKWIPHAWSEDKSTRYVAANRKDVSEVVYDLANVMRNREENEKNDIGKIKKPYYIVFVSNLDMLSGQGITRYMFDKEKDWGLSTVLLTDSAVNLPNQCDFVIENSEQFQGTYLVSDAEATRKNVKFDYVSEEELGQFARKILPLHVPENEIGGEMPNSITFFDMYDIKKIEDYPVKEMWAKSKNFENIKGMLGQKNGGVPVYLDLHEKFHGPHGLVAGTTGSGKSETLQTYLLSLAINYSPDDIGFFIIDYKGGGMANLFDGLPHMIGSISNLSGNQVNRAMISIKSENKRRQRAFAENGVNNINAYTKMYKAGEVSEPIPHLFIIIDEFAELKREEPEFMKELISVAQVGRSLGVHLILATQKPSGTVDDNIWSNSKFRICLRVQDKKDSKDMLHKEDAAFITQAGRGYLQVGNDEIYEMFQSGFSGAAYYDGLEISTKEVANLISLTGKKEVGENVQKQAALVRIKQLWIRKLCNCMNEVFMMVSGEETEDTTSMDAKLNHLVDLLYDVMEKNGIDYSVNDLNTKRLKSFVTLFGEVSTMQNVYDIPMQILVLASERKIDLPREKEKTELDATVEYLAKVAKENGYNHNVQLWMPVLPQYIFLDEFAEYNRTKFSNGVWHHKSKDKKVEAIVGKLDDPKNQRQMMVTYDFIERGHLIVAGTVTSGKSTLMQTLAYSLLQRYTPQDINIYALDFSSKLMTSLANAPQVGGVMTDEDLEAVDKFVCMLQRILDERKKVFKGGSYKQYCQMHKENEYPAIIVMVDNFGGFKEKTNTAYDDFFIRLSKEGMNVGIYLVVSGTSIGMNDITTRMADNIENSFCLSFPDKFGYVSFFHSGKIDMLPESDIKGRGLVKSDGEVFEYQVALAERVKNDYERMEQIAKVCDEMKSAWQGECAREIPSIPEKLYWSEFEKIKEVDKVNHSNEFMALGYVQKNADIFTIHQKDMFCYLVCGLGRTGKTNYMRVMLNSVVCKDSDIVILDGGKKELKSYDKYENVSYYDTEDEIVSYFSDTLLPVFKERNKKKWQLIDREYDEDEIYEEMKVEKPVFVFIGDLVEFIEKAYARKDSFSAMLENFTEKGSMHNIFFIGELNVSKAQSIKKTQLLLNMASYQTGIHFGGSLSDNFILPFAYVSFKQMDIKEKAGVGILPGERGYDGTYKVVIPMARK